MGINVVDYWPFDLAATNGMRRFDYGSFSSVFWWDKNESALVYDDYDSAGKWKDRWFLRYVPGIGVEEFRDEYPLSGIQSRIFGNIKTVCMSPGIGWGEYAEIGGVYTNSPKMSFWKSWPPQFGSGKQTVVFEALHSVFISDSGVVYHDVLQFTYQQKFGNGLQTGARYFMAKGIGPVAIQWIGLAPTGEIVQSERMDAKPLLVS